eukprot:TRINITY_DN1659_c0_g1_i1.p3 TRINITY_DN1659_c0_g1~~TRINITY_DN1659_c0_g1_i1.p3  ORF type:complete len:113 (-),score=25.57 TRINITY_DN1659_c0_g1_i1:938-1276(-)
MNSNGSKISRTKSKRRIERLLKTNQKLKSECTTYKDDRNMLIKQLLGLKKENERLKKSFAQIYENNKEGDGSDERSDDVFGVEGDISSIRDELFGLHESTSFVCAGMEKGRQ